jgi:hypothetical protein
VKVLAFHSLLIYALRVVRSDRVLCEFWEISVDPETKGAKIFDIDILVRRILFQKAAFHERIQPLLSI